MTKFYIITIKVKSTYKLNIYFNYNNNLLFKYKQIFILSLAIVLI